MPPNTVSVARPGSFGNPARVVETGMVWAGEFDDDGEPIDSGPWACLISRPGQNDAGFWFATRGEASAKAVEYFRARCTLPIAAWRPMQARISELRGKNLACWCPLDQPCHADVLLELANAPAEVGDV